jgi:hypothetical protein
LSKLDLSTNDDGRIVSSQSNMMITAVLSSVFGWLDTLAVVVVAVLDMINE